MHHDFIQLSLTFEGHFCNSWPELEITANSECIWKGSVEASHRLDLQFPSAPLNRVKISYINKRNGPTVWDTVIDDQGHIIEDQHCILKRILIDRADCSWLIQDAIYHYLDGTNKKNFGFMDLKGHMELVFPDDVYEWLLDHRREKGQSASLRQSSLDYKNIYIPQHNHPEIQNLIAEIKKLLDHIHA